MEHHHPLQPPHSCVFLIKNVSMVAVELGDECRENQGSSISGLSVMLILDEAGSLVSSSAPIRLVDPILLFSCSLFALGKKKIPSILWITPETMNKPRLGSSSGQWGMEVRRKIVVFVDYKVFATNQYTRGTAVATAVKRYGDGDFWERLDRVGVVRE